jgi:hypothetical protein
VQLPTVEFFTVSETLYFPGDVKTFVMVSLPLIEPDPKSHVKVEPGACFVALNWTTK